MQYKRIARNVYIAFLSQGVSFFVSAIMILVLPKVLSVESYGYWQLFLFYSSFSGFFLFGLCDGIYLQVGGKLRRDVDKEWLNSQYLIGFLLLAVSGAVVGIYAVVSSGDSDRTFVLWAFAVFTVVSDVEGLLGYTFQALDETRLFSVATIVDRVAFLVIMICLLVLNVQDYRVYIVVYVLSKCAGLLYCSWKAKDILFAGRYSILVALKESLKSISVGYKLMFAAIADMLILGLCRIFIDDAWGIEAFAAVSLALSIVNFFITFVSQASMVMFPVLRQENAHKQRRFYQAVRDGMELLFPVAYALFFPLAWGLSVWLPEYSDSIQYFALLLPVCVFNTKMDLCCATYFKVLRMEQMLLLVNVVAVAISFLGSAFGVYLFGSVQAVLVAAVACIIARSIASEAILNKKLCVPRSAASYEEIALTLVFICLSYYCNNIIGFIIYTILYAAYLWLNIKSVSKLSQTVKALIGSEP